jgi:glycosyltransferase involved in cell wall biosynthesis
MKPLLSILIPTYNRSKYLERLLRVLERELEASAISPDVEVIIGDNCSTDETAELVTRILPRNPLWKYYRRVANLGLDGNTLSLLSESRGTYRWIIGDDDFPRAGTIRFVLDYLRTEPVSLLYLPSRWAEDISGFEYDPITRLDFIPIRGLDCSRKLHIWVTFLSSWIFNADQLFSGLATLEEISANRGTQLLQLGCILPLLALSSAKLLEASDVCIYATSGNTGGYSVLRTFLVNYPRLVVAYTNKRISLRRALIGSSLTSYMPHLIHAVKTGKGFNNAGNSSGVLWQSMRCLWSYPLYWLTCLPLILMPSALLRILRRGRYLFGQY